MRRLLRDDPVPVARPRGRRPRPRAQPHRPPDADPLGLEEGQPAAPANEREGEAAGPGSRPAAPRHRGSGGRPPRVDPEAHRRRCDRRRRAGPARGTAARLRRAPRRDAGPGRTGTCGPAAWTAFCGAAMPRSSMPRTSRGSRSRSSTRPTRSTSSRRPSASGSSTARCSTTSGCYIGYAKHQRHSYYLITHGDLTGFSADEIEVLASLARYHKGGRPKLTHENWRRLDPYLQAVVEKLAAILRIADGLDRSHRQIVTGVACRVRSRRIELERERARRLRGRARRRAQEGEPLRAHLRPPRFAAGGAGRERRGRASEGPRDRLGGSPLELTPDRGPGETS